mgnify:CR=1 FL=1
MEIDYRDGITIGAASTGMLLGSLIGIGFESEILIIWSIGGLVTGAGLGAYLFSIEAKSNDA